ncbi:type III pantothenate kinase [Guyparkeria sp. 1SP6A2]|nr:type III pantothenate kinase [Guyparkeria sp. 1SP6A2]
MNCYIDAGNSRIKGRLTRRSAEGDLSFTVDWPDTAVQPLQVDSATPGVSLADRLVDLLADHLVDDKGRCPRQVVIASVVDDARRGSLEAAVARLCPEAAIRWLTVPKKCCHVRVGYREPAALGIDRFCALVEARARCGAAPAVVINAGTAITLDVLDASGAHLGGVILPGWRASLDGLRRAAPGLAPAVGGLLDAPEAALGGDEAAVAGEVTRRLGLATDTATGIRLGQHWLLGAGLNQMIALWWERLAGDPHGEAGGPTVLITGGDATWLAGLVDPAFPVREEPDLVMVGMMRLARARR